VRVVLLLMFGGLMFFLATSLSDAIWGHSIALVILLPLLSNDPEYIAELRHHLSQPIDLLVSLGAVIGASALTYPFGWLLFRHEARSE
jgi:hypothetical protein